MGERGVREGREERGGEGREERGREERGGRRGE